jgi:UDP-arabinose 4-epimerase
MTQPAPALLVTRGAGYVGSHVCKAAAAAGYLPVSYDNLAGGHGAFVRWGPLEQGDLRDAARLAAVLARWRPTAVLHLAGVIDSAASVADPQSCYDNNLVGTLTLLRTMRAAGVARLVFSSSAAVYGEPQSLPVAETHALQPLSPYGRSKAMIETMLQDFARAGGLRSVSLRYFNAAGADAAGQIGEAHPDETHLIPLALQAACGQRSHLAIHGDDYDTRDGTCLRDYVHVDDLARAHLAALKALDGEPGAAACNLGSGGGATVREIVAAVARATGRPVPVVTGPRRPGAPAVLLAEIARARQMLDWTPQCSDLATIIGSAWGWHNRRPPVQAAAGQDSMRTVSA